MQTSMVNDIFLHFNNPDKIPHPRHEYYSYYLVFTWRHHRNQFGTLFLLML